MGANNNYDTNNDTILHRETKGMPLVIDLFGGAERDRTAGLLVAKTMRNVFSTT
jgi:hypothetical protein